MSYYYGSKLWTTYYTLGVSMKICSLFRKRKQSEEHKLFTEALYRVLDSVEQPSKPIFDILTSLSNDADILLLDEPFTYLKREERE